MHDAVPPRTRRIIGERSGRTVPAAALAAGTVSGVFAAWCYYNDPWRPFAHTVGLWVVLAVVCGRGRGRHAAVLAVTAMLLAAVVAFHVGKVVFHNARYAGSLDLNGSRLVLWCVLALMAGAAIGVLVSAIGQQGPVGVLAASAVIGLLVGEAYDRHREYGVVTLGADAAVVFDALAAVAVVVLAARSGARAAWVVAAAVPLSVVGYLVVRTPDWIEQFMITL